MSEAIQQRASENIDMELDTMGVIVYGKQGSGKTTIMLELAFENWEKRIYSNFSIYKNGKQINTTVQSAKAVMNIRFSYTPGIIVIDEAGINANSKDGRSQDNRNLIEVLFLARKYNCSFGWISQRFESIDVNARVLADLILKMRKIRRGDHRPLFEVTRQKQKGHNLELVNVHRIDTIAIMKYDKLTYNTLETAKFVDPGTGKKAEVKILREKSKIEGEEGKILSVNINT